MYIIYIYIYRKWKYAHIRKANRLTATDWMVPLLLDEVKDYILKWMPASAAIRRMNTEMWFLAFHCPGHCKLVRVEAWQQFSSRSCHHIRHAWLPELSCGQATSKVRQNREHLHISLVPHKDIRNCVTKEQLHSLGNFSFSDRSEEI